MLDAVVEQLQVGAVILLAGIGLFLTVNKKRPVVVEGVDPATGERTTITRWERGTRRSRWRGYCTLGGAVLGVQLPGMIALLLNGEDAIRPGLGVGMTAAPFGMLFGLLAGLALGAVSSQFIPEKAPPRDPDNP